MPSRVVPPLTTKLPISGGDWLLVRTRLNHGEQQDSFRRMFMSGIDGQRHVDPLQTGMAIITAYLVDWSLTGLDDQPIAIRNQPVEMIESALKSFDHETFVEIKEAIEAHELRVLAARAQEKKDPAGTTTLPTISASPSEPAGASSGSAS